MREFVRQRGYSILFVATLLILGAAMQIGNL
jgi:hypothetical protein